MQHMKRDNLDPQRYTRRSSLRLPEYDYASSGAYYVTICVEHRWPVLEIPEIRTALVEIWQTLPARFPTVKLDEFVVMPDHVHGILWLESESENINEEGKNPALDRVMGAYKSLTTLAWLNYHKARSITCSKHLWQRGYHDHIIRNDDDLSSTRQYIRDNPLKLQLKNNTLPDS